MALLWADGFDHYGTDENNLLDGVYASANGALEGTTVATGIGSWYVNTFDGTSAINGLRKVLPTSNRKMGVTFRLYLPILPLNDTAAQICDFLSGSALRSHVSCMVDTNGALRFYRGYFYGFNGGNGTLIATTDPIVTASAWQHVEIQIYIHDTDGWIRVAINGAHEFEATGLDTSYDGTNITSIAHHNGYYTSSAGVYISRFYLDDLIYYDFVGSSAVETDFVPSTDGDGKATNYIGELQCRYLPPDGNTAEDDWDKSTGSSAFALVDETTPDDTDYISSDTVTDLTELDFTDLPPEITYIRGCVFLGRLFKTDAGYAETQFGAKSVAAVTDAAARPITVEPTYWWDFINVDPNSGARWTRTSLNAAKFRLTRNA